MATLPATVRPLGLFERLFAARHDVGLHNAIVMVAGYAVPPDLADDLGAGGLVRARVAAALAVVVGRVGMLRTVIVDEDKARPRFVGVASLDVRDHLEWEEEEEQEAAASQDQDTPGDPWLEALLERESRRDWPGVAVHPPWRLVGLVRADGRLELALTAHHVLADGQSGLAFHGYLLEALREGEAASPSPSVALPPPVLTFSTLPALGLPQEDLVRFHLSWSFFVRTLWSELGPLWLKRVAAWLLPGALRSPDVKPYLGAALPVPSAAAVRLPPARMSVLTIPADVVPRLLAVCRAHGTTLTPLLHGLLAAAVLRAVARFEETGGGRLCNGGQGFPGSLMVTSPVSLRPYLRQLGDRVPFAVDRAMGNYLSTYQYLFRAPTMAALRAAATPAATTAAAWAATAEIDISLRACTADVLRDSTMGLLGWVRDWHAWWRDKAARPPGATWEVSNVGVALPGGFDAKDAGPDAWHLTRILLAFTAVASGTLLSLTAMSVRGGPLTLGLVRVRGPDGSEDELVCEAARADLGASLQRFAETGEFF